MHFAVLVKIACGVVLPGCLHAPSVEHKIVALKWWQTQLQAGQMTFPGPLKSHQTHVSLFKANLLRKKLLGHSHYCIKREKKAITATAVRMHQAAAQRQAWWKVKPHASLEFTPQKSYVQRLSSSDSPSYLNPILCGGWGRDRERKTEIEIEKI